MASLTAKQKAAAAALFARAVVEQGGLRHLLEEAQREAEAQDEVHEAEQGPSPSHPGLAAPRSRGQDVSGSNFWRTHEEELLLVMHVFRFLGVDSAEAEAYLEVATLPENKAIHVDGLLQMLQAEESHLPASSAGANEGVARAVQVVMEEDTQKHREAGETVFRAIRHKWELASRRWRWRKGRNPDSSLERGDESRGDREGPGPLASLQERGGRGSVSSGALRLPQEAGDGSMQRSKSSFLSRDVDLWGGSSLTPTRSLEQLGSPGPDGREDGEETMHQRSMQYAGGLEPSESFLPSPGTLHGQQQQLPHVSEGPGGGPTFAANPLDSFSGGFMGDEDESWGWSEGEWGAQEQQYQDGAGLGAVEEVSTGIGGLTVSTEDMDEAYQRNRETFAAATAAERNQEGDRGQQEEGTENPVLGISSALPAELLQEQKEAEAGMMPVVLSREGGSAPGEGEEVEGVLAQADPMHMFTASRVPLKEGTKVLILWELLSSFLSSSKHSAGRSTESHAFALVRRSFSRGAPAPAARAVGEWFGRAYDARERTAVRIVALWLGTEWHFVGAVERTVSCVSLEQSQRVEETASKAGAAAQESQRTKASGWAGWSRAASVGAAAVGTGALLAFTGGLAAPIVFGGAAFLGSSIPIAGTAIAGIAALASTSVGSAAVIGACGVAGAQLGGYKMNRRLGDVEGFRFIPLDAPARPLPSSASGKGTSLLHQQSGRMGKIEEKAEQKPKPARLAAAVCVSGFGLEFDELVDVWAAVPMDLERFALVYEPDELMRLSKSVYNWFTSDAMQKMMSNTGQMLLLRALGAAFTLPMALISATNFIDSQWAVLVNRSEKAGVLLAEVLVKRVHGPRPVTLLGFSLGARVVFSCLCHLATNYTPEETSGLIEQVVILGAPVPARDSRWPKIRGIVAGRVVNGYCTTDWILGLVYRTSFLMSGIAGIQPVNVPGVQNVDLTKVVDSHAEYGMNMDRILDLIDF